MPWELFPGRRAKTVVEFNFQWIYATKLQFGVLLAEHGGIISACLVKNAAAARSIGGCDCAFQLPILMDYKLYSIRELHASHKYGQIRQLCGFQ